MRFNHMLADEVFTRLSEIRVHRLAVILSVDQANARLLQTLYPDTLVADLFISRCDCGNVIEVHEQVYIGKAHQVRCDDCKTLAINGGMTQYQATYNF